ncbi:SMI1/KNR4 family protein [Streptomyces sp. TRM49041]|uniref:SMI1/KNR4 family protein n=1 Tax=Streptomyces sp. TRM49041 TaxID=2603216 RepID=UPI0011EEC9BE|nr:SMI1/KNR4 family protein [Streptomyces sp. TRM49041]
MSWVDRLAQAAGEHPLGLDLDWAEIESRLGTALPADYKEFCEAFGTGEFCDFLTVYASAGGAESELADSQEANRRIVEQHPVALDLYLPHGLQQPGSQGGLLQWGVSVQGDEFAWIADNSAPPESWPVFARDDAGKRQRFDMSMSEFVYRLLADESFEGFAGFGATGEDPWFTRYP